MKRIQCRNLKSPTSNLAGGRLALRSLQISLLATLAISGCDPTQKTPQGPDFPGDKEWIELRGVSDSDAPNEALYNWVRYGIEGDTELISIDSAGMQKLETAKHFDGRLYRLDQKFEEAVCKAPHLEWLCVADGARAHDLEWICRLDKLRGLSMAYAKLGDADLQLLQNLKNLQWLHLSGAELPSAKVSKLPRLPQLEVLWVNSLNVDAPFKHYSTVGQLPKLRVLSASDNMQLTDDELPKLIESNPGLRYLALGMTGTTSHTLLEFAKLQDLRYLHLYPTQRQFHEMPSLQSRLPNCYLMFSD